MGKALVNIVREEGGEGGKGGGRGLELERRVKARVFTCTYMPAARRYIARVERIIGRESRCLRFRSAHTNDRVGETFVDSCLSDINKARAC